MTQWNVYSLLLCRSNSDALQSYPISRNETLRYQASYFAEIDVAYWCKIYTGRGAHVVFGVPVQPCAKYCELVVSNMLAEFTSVKVRKEESDLSRLFAWITNFGDKPFSVTQLIVSCVLGVILKFKVFFGLLLITLSSDRTCSLISLLEDGVLCHVWDCRNFSEDQRDSS